MTLRSIRHSRRHSRTRTFAAALLTSTALVAAGPAWAQTWDGSASSDWNTGANWSTNAVPSSAGNVVINDITVNSPVIGTGVTATAANVTLQGTARLDILGGGTLSTNGPAFLSTAASDNVSVTVTGAGSAWSSTSTANPLLIGTNSAGVTTGPVGFEILSGGLVDFNSTLTLGATSTLRVSGVSGATASRLSATSGSNLAGAVTIENGGTAEFENLSFVNGGSLTVQSGGLLTKTSTGTLTVGQTAQVLITGAGTVVDSAGGVSLINSAVGTAAADFVVADNAVLNFTGSVGPGVAFSGSATGENRNLIIRDGGQINGGGISGFNGSVLISKGGAYITTGNWSLGGNSALSITSGGRLDLLGAFNPDFSQQTEVLISGSGSVLNVTAALSLISSNIGDGSGDFVIADGAVVNVNSASQSGLAFGEERLLSVTDSTLNMTGGLSMNRGTLVATNSTLNFGNGTLQMGPFFGGNTLTLINSGITAGTIATSAVGNVINLGGTASGSAGAVGAFNVGNIILNNDATLNINHTNTGFNIAGVISGLSTGVINHIAGDTIFSGNSTTFGVQTLVTGGRLRVNGTLGNASHTMTVSNNATLGGSGTIGGAVTIADATLAPGNSPGTLTFAGDLLLGSASILDFELGSPSGTAGVDSDLINVSGNLILDGTLNVTDAGGFGAGLYRLINYTGTLTDNVLDVGTVPAGFAASDLTVQTAVANEVNLLVGAPVLPTSGFMWDGANTTANNAVDGGAGTWDATGANWTNANGSANGAFDNDVLLIFTGTPGAVTVDNAAGQVVLDEGVQFAVDGYSVSGGDILMNGPRIFRVGDGTAAGADFTATIDANLTGTGALEFTDLGTLILNGANTYTGDTEINAGRLVVNGSVASVETFVLSGGTLAGTGTIAGTTFVNNGGAIAPGNSIGTLNVANIEFAAGSTYTVELNDGGNAAGVNNDLINATGTATINGGTVHVTPENGTDTGTTYTAGTYTIITATGGVTGTFDTLTEDYAFLNFALSYDASNVFLNSSLVATTFCLDGMTVNECAAGEGTFSLGAGGLFTAVLNLSNAEAFGAMDALSGEIHASAKTALLDDSRFVREAVLGRLNGASGQAEKRTTERFAFWGEGFGSWGQWDSDSNAADLDRNIGGLVMGGDASLNENVRIGAMGGYSHSSLDVDDRTSAAIVDSYTLGAYAGGQWGAYSLKGGLAQSWHDIEAAREIAFTGFTDSLSTEYKARTLQVYGEAAYDIDLENARLTPYAGIFHVRLNTDGYTETGGAAALTAASNKANATFSTLGFRGERELDLGGTEGAVSMGIGWRHSFDDLTPETTHALAGGDAFTVYGVPLATDALALNAGFGVNLGKTATLGVSYNGQIGSGVSDHGARASFALRF